MTQPAIVVVAYNRPDSLSRLFQSLGEAHYPVPEVQLIISIDLSDSDEVHELANSFVWPHGKKRVIKHDERLGLKEHMFFCGDLTGEYGSIVLLEDDLIVSPYFYKYSLQALKFYSDKEKVAGISLYSYQISENGFFPFYPNNDGSDTYFVQFPSSWGEVITADSWMGFREWNKEHISEFPESILPEYIRAWPAQSWKKRFAAYLIASDKYFVFPRTSYSTNPGDPGANTDRKGVYQVPLMFADKEQNFKELTQSLSVYDAYFEINPHVLKRLNPLLQDYDFTVDLHATKPLPGVESEFLLSSKKCNNAIFTYGNDLPDPVQNVLSNAKGSFYSFGKRTDFEPSSPHVFDFYTNLNPISDIVMSKHIDDFEFDQKYPRLFVGIVHDFGNQNLNETLKSIFIQSYPKSQIQVEIFNTSGLELSLEGDYGKLNVTLSTGREAFVRDFCATVDSSKAEYYVVMRSGDVFYNHIFDAVNNILKRYPDLNWLTGIETILSDKGFNIFYGNTAMRRWNPRIYQRNLYKNSLRYIPPAATFWKRYLWRTAQEDLNFVSRYNFYEDLWLAFFKSQNLFTCDVYFSSSPMYNTPKLSHPRNLIEYSLIEDGFINRMQEFFFINNIPYLRVFYKVKNHLADVIRLDHEGQWYFQSDF